jgi:hypothetical protein
MKEARNNRRITLRYRHDAATARTVLVIDVESPADEMPHEHVHDLKAMAAEVLGVPLDQLPDGVEVRLRPQGHTHPPDPARAEETVPAPRQAHKH